MAFCSFTSLNCWDTRYCCAAPGAARPDSRWRNRSLPTPPLRCRTALRARQFVSAAPFDFWTTHQTITASAGNVYTRHYRFPPSPGSENLPLLHPEELPGWLKGRGDGAQPRSGRPSPWRCPSRPPTFRAAAAAAAGRNGAPTRTRCTSPRAPSPLAHGGRGDRPSGTIRPRCSQPGAAGLAQARVPGARTGAALPPTCRNCDRRGPTSGAPPRRGCRRPGTRAAMPGAHRTGLLLEVAHGRQDSLFAPV